MEVYGIILELLVLPWVLWVSRALFRIERDVEFLRQDMESRWDDLEESFPNLRAIQGGGRDGRG